MKRILGAVAVIVLLASATAFAQKSSSTSLFRILKGDVLTFEFSMVGDLLETNHPTTIELQAKQNMWIRVTGNKVEASLDGQNFRPISDLASGALAVGIVDPEASTFSVNLSVNAK